MAKVKQPLLSFDARRKLGDDIVYVHRAGHNVVEKKPIPKDARSIGQLSWRHMFLKVVALWHALSAAEKEAWESLGRKRHMTGYAWFISQALRPNPGIYLPLQGGIMQGIIDMDGYAIQNLLDPVNPQDADTEAARDAAIAAIDVATKETFNSVHWGAAMGFAGSKVDGAGDEAGLVLLFPQDFTSITILEISFIPLQTAAGMHFNFHTRWAAYNGGEPVNAHTETENARDIGATVTIQYVDHDISDLVDVVAPVKGDFLQVLVGYNATAVDSNAYVTGIRLKYT